MISKPQISAVDAAFSMPFDTAVDVDLLRSKVGRAVHEGLVATGLAHRVILAALLLRASAGAAPATPAGTAPGASPVASPPVLSGEELAHTLGLTRAGIHKHVGRLRALGFAVESLPGIGYRLEQPFIDLVSAEAVLPLLLGVRRPEMPWIAGLPYLYLAQCGSTNLGLKELAAVASEIPGGVPPAGTSPAGALPGGAFPGGAFSRRARGTEAPPPPGTLLLTDEQTRGRGRLGRGWSSEAGKDLTFSVFLRPTLAPAQAHLLSLAAAVAVAEVLEMLPGIEAPVAVKWPNDVLLGEEKVCGILLEGSMDDDRLQWAVAGMGLNVNSTPSTWSAGMTPEEAEAWVGRPRPVSLFERLGREVPRAPLLAAILERLTARWSDLEEGAEAGVGGILAALRSRDALAGRRVEVLAGRGQPQVVVSGEAAGIGPEGQLLVRDASGETVGVFAGDVTLGLVNHGWVSG